MASVDMLIVNASELLTARTDAKGATGQALQTLEIIADGALAIHEGRIVAVGDTATIKEVYTSEQVIDANGQLVSPGLIDCHSHLLYGGTRHAEYESIVSGQRDPNRKLGGGIRYTVSRTRVASDQALRQQALHDLDAMLLHGTTTLEAKSGYGLSREAELRLLQLVSELHHVIDIAITFMGAHVVPEEYETDRAAYVDLVIDMLEPARQYAEFCDVFCDPTGFTVDECRRILQAADALRYFIKVHADQTGPYQGAELAGEFNAVSADHLDYISPAGINSLLQAGTVGVLLPGVTFHMLEMIPRADEGLELVSQKPFMPQLARRLINAGMCLALSADYNPGSSPTLSMQIVMQLAARMYRLNYAEIWHMCTINAAHALRYADRMGSLEVDKQADVLIWSVPEHGMVVNRFGVNQVHTVIKRGRVVVQNGQLTQA